MRRPWIRGGTAPTAVVVVLLSSAAAVPALWAGDIYKSVDAQGHVVYSDQPDPSTQQTRVEIADSPWPPRTLHFCWTNCFTLILSDGAYVRADGTDETWTVERFTANSVRLHRHDAPADWNGFRTDVIYEGDVSNDRLINITVNGKPTSGVDAAWGAALNTLPGSNAERDHPTDVAAVSTDQAPPPLPDEEQPVNSQDGALWTPGYWSWSGRRYFWMPGAWVRPPQSGMLWTPGYWGFEGGYYVFHPGHWGPQVGYYGGINYGFGYTGNGFVGGRWVGNSFAYNTAVTKVNTGIVHNTYNEAAISRVGGARASYNTGSFAPSSVGESRIAQASPQGQYSPPSARLPQPTPAVNPQASVTHRQAVPAPPLGETHDTSAQADDGQSRHAGTSTRSITSTSSGTANVQATSKQTSTPKISAPKSTQPHQ